MYIKHCKLSKNKKLELMNYFIAGATARTAADLVRIHRILPYVFSTNCESRLPLNSKIVMSSLVGQLNSMKVILVVLEKVNVAEELQARLLYLVF